MFGGFPFGGGNGGRFGVGCLPAVLTVLVMLAIIGAFFAFMYWVVLQIG